MLRRYLWLVLAICYAITLNPLHTLAASPDSLRWYAGDTHIHTAIHAVSSIAKRVEEGIAGGLDWVAITRHKRSGAFWKAHEVDAAFDRHYPRMAPILGMEWDEPPELGREDIVVLGVSRHSPIPEDNLQSVIDWSNREGGVFIFAHPSPFVFENIHKWSDYIAFEGYSGSPGWNPACQPGAAWDALLTEGDPMFIVGASDNHGQPYLGDRIVKTYVLAKSNRPADIIEGIRAGRVYVSERGQVRLDFSVDGKGMGETIIVDQAHLQVELTVDADIPITLIQLIGNGKEVWSVAPDTTAYESRFQVPVSPSLRYVRLIVETAETTTMGNPVFLTQEGVTQKTAKRKTPPHPLADWHQRMQGGRNIMPELQAALQIQLADSDPVTRMNAAYGMIEFGVPNTLDALFTLAADSIPQVRAYAARMLAGRAGVDHLPQIRTLLRDEDPLVRLWAVRAIELTGVSEARSILFDMLDDGTFWVHFAAVEGLLDIAAQDITVFDDLTDRVRAGDLNAADPFNWAPPDRKSAMIELLQDQYDQTPSDNKALYLALERLGASPAKTYRFTAERATTPPLIDGRLDDAVWQDTPPTISLVQDDVSGTSDAATQAHIVYDDQALYVAFRCPASQNDSNTPQDVEYVMIGFDTNHNGGIDYTFEIDRNGQIFGEKDGITAWQKPVQMKSSTTSTGWLVEIAIPYTSIEWLEPVADKTWGFNIGHGARGQNTRLTSWAPTLGQPSNANRYGTLLFGD